jgi:hypothetical protein
VGAGRDDGDEEDRADDGTDGDPGATARPLHRCGASPLR